MPETPKRPLTPPAECANCGAAIPRHAKACPECGADERTGWRETSDSIYDGLDLPDEAFEADGDASAEARRRQTAPRVNGLPWYWWVVGVGSLVALVAWVLGWR